MKKKLKRLSLINLIIGYVMCVLFILLVVANRPPAIVPEDTTIVEAEVPVDDLFTGVREDNLEREVIYIDRGPTEIVRDRGVGVVFDDDPDIVVADDIAVVGNPRHVSVYDKDFAERNTNFVHGGIDNEAPNVGDRVVSFDADVVDGSVSRVYDDTDVVVSEPGGSVEGRVDLGLLEKHVRALKEKEAKDFGIEDEESLSLTLDRDTDVDFDIEGVSPAEGGKNKGDLYAYNSPSVGIGAGIGSPAIGAGAGSAGLGAGIGEAVLDGKPVPALGGVGTPYSLKGPALSMQGGVGGLVGGAGAGGAAGLTTALAKEKLGLGIGNGAGLGVGVGGGSGADYKFKDLPPDGGLHIMMHVDGSGSILNTRKQLDIMRDTLLKEALLAYYNNDESLYNNRVTIVDGNGERTLQFFREAAKKDNVLAVVFQDEAQPAYHMPNFNRKPEDRYLNDLNSLKSSLGGHTGLYRGIMLQVDRGNTFARSFKEFVENSWQGKGYLEGHNLKKYYWENNKHHIDNKDGIVFSDVYHVKDEENPSYYLNLIFEAAKRVGVDLRAE